MAAVAPASSSAAKTAGFTGTSAVTPQHGVVFSSVRWLTSWLYFWPALGAGLAAGYLYTLALWTTLAVQWIAPAGWTSKLASYEPAPVWRAAAPPAPPAHPASAAAPAPLHAKGRATGAQEPAASTRAMPA